MTPDLISTCHSPSLLSAAFLYCLLSFYKSISRFSSIPKRNAPIHLTLFLDLFLIYFCAFQPHRQHENIICHSGCVVLGGSRCKGVEPGAPGLCVLPPGASLQALILFAFFLPRGHPALPICLAGNTKGMNPAAWCYLLLLYADWGSIYKQCAACSQSTRLQTILQNFQLFPCYCGAFIESNV